MYIIGFALLLVNLNTVLSPIILEKEGILYLLYLYFGGVQ